ncbi:pectin acetylesterase-family hydrolase [Pseudohongiella acticola]|jgi:Pectinacetylesterase|uniref:pectin acetylesterase-family hydrolase n=1 Tax=Pseudohongiella acticola TaxID=1524254 RepID=UPI0030EDAA0A
MNDNNTGFVQVLRNLISGTRTRLGIMLLLALSALAACSEPEPTAVPDVPTAVNAPAVAAEEQMVADFSGLQDGWNAFSPGGETICTDGSEYRFFVKQGEPDKLMFYLEGGGACWDGANCDPDLQPSYQINLAATDPANSHGILAFEHPENPFADYTVVYAPYCSADVHLGDSVQVHTAPTVEGHESHEVNIQHRGLVNASAAMQWAIDHLPMPEQIFVTGSSAGSIPSPFYALKLAQQYPGADIVQLGDASGGYRGFANFSPYDVWSTDQVLAEMDYINNIPANEFSFHQLYIGVERENPGIRFASYDNAEDNVQKQFLALGGTPTESLLPLLQGNLEEISTAIPDFRYYVAGGTMHTILLRPEVYSYEVAGVRFVDWLTELAAGEPVQNVMCVDCTMAPEPVQAP